MNAIDTKIDDRCCSGSLAGVCEPGERFTVERVSAVEVRMRLVIPATIPKATLTKSHGRTVLRGAKMTAEQVATALQDFP